MKQADPAAVRAAAPGDAGRTCLGDGTRVPRHHPRMHALGDVEELNAALGVLLAEPLPAALRAELLAVQHELFTLAGELSVPGFELLDAGALARLDAARVRYQPAGGRLAGFVLPGGTRAAALAHACRALSRRAERSLAGLAASEPLRQQPLQYLNRLSDLLLGIARALNRADGGAPGAEVYWSPHAPGRPDGQPSAA